MLKLLIKDPCNFEVIAKDKHRTCDITEKSEPTALACIITRISKPRSRERSPYAPLPASTFLIAALSVLEIAL